MRFLVIEPGPNFSVADVCRGWVRALSAEGHEVVPLNLADRLTFYESAHHHRDGRCVQTLTARDAIALASKGIQGVALEYWPDVCLR